MSSLGKKKQKKHIKFNNKTEVNGKELNTMVKKYHHVCPQGGEKETHQSGHNVNR